MTWEQAQATAMLLRLTAHFQELLQQLHRGYIDAKRWHMVIQ